MVFGHGLDVLVFIEGQMVNPVVALNSASGFTPLETMHRCSLRARGPLGRRLQRG